VGSRAVLDAVVKRKVPSFENRVLRKIFQSEREEDWRKFHDEELHSL
jgi:hypothetical protein